MIALYKHDKGPEKDITLWYPVPHAKTKAHRNTIIRDWLADIVAEHRDGFSNDISTTSNKNGSDTPSVYTTTQLDLEMLQLYHNDEVVPERAAAILIGEAKGRSDGMLSVPPSVNGKSNAECYSGYCFPVS